MNHLGINTAELSASQLGALRTSSFVAAESVVLVFFACSLFSIQSELNNLQESRQEIASVEKQFNLSVRTFSANRNKSDSVKTLPKNGRTAEPQLSLPNTKTATLALLKSASTALLAEVTELSTNVHNDRLARESAILLQINELERLLKASLAQIKSKELTINTHLDELIQAFCVLFASIAVGLTFLFCGIEKLISVRISSLFHRGLLLSEGRTLTLPSEGSVEFAIIDKHLYETSVLWNDSKRKARMILDNAADVICTIDPNFHFVELSRASKKAWAYEANELAGTPLSIVLSAESIQVAKHVFAAAVQNQQPSECEFILNCKDNRRKTFLWTINWSPSSKRFYCTAHDITDLKLAQQFRQDLMNMVTHDMRAPLTSAKVSLSLLDSGQYGDLPEPVKTALKQTDAEIEKINDMVETLLELQRLERLQQVNVNSCVSVFELCVIAIKEYRNRFPYSCVEIATPLGDGAVYGAEDKLSRAFFHLLCVIAGSSENARSLSIQIKTEKEKVICVFRTNPPFSAGTEEFDLSELNRIRLKIAAILLVGDDIQTSWTDSELTISMPEFPDDEETAE